MPIIIIFVLFLLTVIGYVIWFAFTHGLWNSIMADTKTLEHEVGGLISQAEANANKLGAAITSGFLTFEGQVLGAYNTVSDALVKTANIVKTGGDNAIREIRNGGTTAVNEIGAGTNKAIREIQIIFDTVKTGTDRLVGQIGTEGAAAVRTIETTFGTVKSETDSVIATIKTGGNDAINALVTAYSTAEAQTQRIINEISTGGAGAIDTLRATFATVEAQVGGGSRLAIISIQVAGADAIAQIDSGSKAAIDDIRNAFATLKSGVTTSTQRLSSETQAAFNQIQAAVTEAYTNLATGATRAYGDVKGFSERAVADINDAANKVAATANRVGAATPDVLAMLKAALEKIGATVVSTPDQIDSAVRTAKSYATSTSETLIGQINALAAQIAQQAAANANAAGAALARPLSPTTSGLEPFQNPTEVSKTPVDEALFVNIQPLSIKDTGFLGPYSGGYFQEDSATSNVLKAGCRFLVLHIDFLDSKLDLSLYEVPDHPTLLVRWNDRSLLSKNSGSIKDVATAIANMGFNPGIPHNTMPIILYLHIVQAPSPLKNPDEYLDFMSKIAEQLNPIAPFHLSITPEGNFTRQKMAGEILTMPMRSLEGKVIVMCNADTSIFRASSIDKTKYPPAKDLDFWVNMQVYLDTADDLNGITKLSDPSIQPAVVLVDLYRVINMNQLEMDAFGTKGKRRFVIAMGNRAQNPQAEEVNIALNMIGINSIPIDIFNESQADILLLSREYENQAFRQKSGALQYTA